MSGIIATDRPTERYVMYVKPSEQWWRVQALCGSHPQPDIWFPDRTTPSLQRRRNTAEAKAICHECPVFSACQSYAIEAAYDENARFPRLQGIWAGVDVGADSTNRLRSIVQSPSPYGKIALERVRKEQIEKLFKYHNGPLTA